ncbi:MAG: hypothetical protein QOK15_2056 [Nocardioidaceae bacterium]|nr:hypothetical protein [Nocardioidaceae bacterium]
MSTSQRGAAHDAGPIRGTPPSRAAGGWGWAFVVLLLVSAGMASVPGGADATSTVRDFYTRHTSVIVVAQLIGLVAAAAFVPFTFALRRGSADRRARPDVEAAGCAVAVAALLTAVPVLWLTAVAGTGSTGYVHALAVASDLTDVALFSAIALWAATLVRAATPAWFRALAGIVAVLTLLRALLIIARSSALEVVAPTSFVVLVAVVSTAALVRRPVVVAR